MHDGLPLRHMRAESDTESDCQLTDTGHPSRKEKNGGYEYSIALERRVFKTVTVHVNVIKSP